MGGRGIWCRKKNFERLFITKSIFFRLWQLIKTFKEDILSTINSFFKIARKGFCEMRLVKSPGIYYEMTKIYHGLMVKFAKSWIRKNEFINRQFINNEKSQSDYDQLQCIRGAFIRSWKEWFNLISLAKLSNLFALTINHWSILKTLFLMKVFR